MLQVIIENDSASQPVLLLSGHGRNYLIFHSPDCVTQGLRWLNIFFCLTPVKVETHLWAEMLTISSDSKLNLKITHHEVHKTA